jgi:RHS repeat-associated protein
MRFRSLSFAIPLIAGTLSSCPLMAAENPPVSDDEEGGCEGQGSGSQSFYWFFRIGEGRYEKADMLQLARNAVNEGQRLGRMPRSFEQVFSVSYGQNLTTGLAGINLALESFELDGSVLQISSLKMKRSTSAEVIERNGDYRQILTTNTLADIVGYHVKVYDRAAIGTKGGDGLYIIPGAAVPFREAIVRTPDGNPFSGTVELAFIDRRNADGVRVEVERFARDHAADTQTKETYAASLNASSQVVVGGLLEREVVTYSSRGAKTYDYTLVREKSRIATTAAGPQYGTLHLIERRLEEYRDFTPIAAGGDSAYKRLVREIHGYQTPEARETRYTWYEQSSNLMIHGRLKTKVAPDGNWEFYQYSDSEGAAVHQTIKYSAWRDASFGAAPDGSQAQLSQARKETIEIGSTTGFTSTVTHAGVPTSREIFSSQPQADGSTLCTLSQETGVGGTLAVRTWSLNSPTAAAQLAGRIAWMENPDGTAETYTYTALSGGGFRLVHRKGAGTRAGVTAGTETTTDYNSFIQASVQSTKDIASGLILDFWTAPTVDILGRPTRIEYNGNSADYETFSYSCCGLAQKRDRDGSITTYTRDPLKRVYRQQSFRFDGDAAPIITTTAFEGLTTTVTRGGILSRATTNLLNGETASELSPDQDNDGNPEQTTHVTTYPSGGGKTVTTNHPDAGTEIRTTYVDGQVKSITGTAVPDTSYTYGTHTLAGRGLFTQVTKLTATGGTAEWERTYRDARDRTVRIEYPSDLDADGTLDRISYTYYSAGTTRGRRTKLQHFDDADGKRTTYLYDFEGNRSSVTEQMPAGQSRVTLTAHDVVNDNSLGVCRRVRTTVNGTLTDLTLRSGNGYASRSTSLGRVTTTVKTPSNPAGNSTVTTTLPDSTKQVESTTGNLLAKSATLDADNNEVHSTTYGYDALRRVKTTTDSRTGTTTINGYTAAGQPLAVTDSGNRLTAYTYDSMGRRLSVDAPDATNGSNNTYANITHASYYPTGQVKAIWGDQTNAVFGLYDEQNRLVELRTYRNLAHGNEPTFDTVGVDATTWTYHPQRGLPTRKQYTDGKGTDYTHTPAGQLKTRTWARGVVTTYTYDKGLLTGTAYSDNTPDVTITYDAFGRQVTVTQTNQSAIIYTYDPATLAIDTEAISYDLDHDGTPDFTRLLDRSRDAIRRGIGWQLKNGATIENAVIYDYDTAGRLGRVSGGGLQPPGQFNYTYQSHSVGLLASVTGPVQTVINSWDPTRDVLTLKQNKVGTTVVSSYEYAVNALGQRTNVEQTGIAFGSMRDITWGYDALGQITSADSNIPGHDRAYQYDAIGNRKKAADSLTLPGSDNYTSNALNQYTAVGSINPSYDDDGNATAYPVPAHPNTNSTLAWDAENRLISATVNGTTTTYLYDAQSRRIAAIAPSATTVYVYDVWNPIAEYSYSALAAPRSQLTKTYAWGGDLDGGLQGKGVGGLLAVTEVGMSQVSNYYPTFDGNGNVSEYIDESGVVCAHYEYDPFGRTVVSSGAKSNDFAHRFSTKPLDESTGLYYYGYRYYDPVTGRWPSRDPIEELG